MKNRANASRLFVITVSALLLIFRIALRRKKARATSIGLKINNLKQASKTLNYLTEHNINSYSELESRIDETCKQFDDTADKFKSVERNLNDINILRKHISTYKALRPVYDKYVKSNNKAKFEKEHQREIILFKASHKYLSQEQTDRKLPTLESVNVQRMELEEQRQKLYTDYRKAKKEVSEIDIVKANVDAMLHTPQRSEPTRENQIE